ncbi:MAG: trigger factor [Bacteroidales bacterium]|nr:trigger factor [Bacteroidales bacterium]
MNITKESTGDLTALITVEINENDYAEKVKSALNEYRKKASIPGFRVGKVPFGIVNKMYGKGVLGEEVNKILSEKLNSYITDNKLALLGNPLPSLTKEDKVDLENEKDFTFYFDIALAPEVELELNDKIKANYLDIEISDKMIDDYVLDIQNRFGEHSHPEVVAEGMEVEAEFKQLDADANVLEGGISHKGKFKIDDIKLKTATSKFLGKAKGDKVVLDPMKVFKDNDKVAAMLAVAKEMIEDLKADFEAEIVEIHLTIPAEINEDLYKKAYPTEEMKTVEEFRAKIKEDASKQFVGESDKLFLSETVDMLIEKANIQIPADFMKRWVLANSEGKLTAEQIDVEWVSYEHSLKWQLLQEKLFKENEIKVEQPEVREHIKGFIGGQYFGGQTENEALMSQMDGIVDTVMQNKEEVNKIYDQLYDKKMLDLFKEKLSLKNKSVSLEDFITKASQAPKA